MAGREFTHECEIALKSLAPFRQGVELAHLVEELEIFPDKPSWSVRLRRPLVPLPPRDAMRIALELGKVARSPGIVLDDYM
jgi:hypothetical protein